MTVTTQRARFGRRPATVLAAALLAAALGGCHQDMWNQPRYTALQPSALFDDGAASRPIPAGTVAFNDPRTDDHFYTGKVNGEFATEFPEQVTVDMDLLQRGQEQFRIYCALCHGMSGTGNGMIVERGFKQPTSYHDIRLKSSPPGYLFDVITNGFGTMYSYASRVAPEDRWAIVAYIRALQLSHQPYTEMTNEQRNLVDEATAAAAETGQDSDAAH